MRWQPGMKIVHRAQREWGVGLVIDVADDGRRLAVRFAGRDGVTVVSGRDPALAEVPRDTPLEAPKAGPLDELAGGRAGPASAFALRGRVAQLESLRRSDALGALLSSRVHVLPHQVGAAGRILGDRAPRFVLADEVGLGKTVEAGLVYAGLRQMGIAERVLVIVPEHLSFQWLAELFHKFNALFSLLGDERMEGLAEAGDLAALLSESPRAIVSLERLRDEPALAGALAAIPHDLVIVDEAHHLADDDFFKVVEPVAQHSFGLLLLTATPVRLDPKEYFRLLSLVEPIPTRSVDDLLKRLGQQEAFAQVARELLAGGEPAAAVKKLAKLAPDDAALAKLGGDREALLAHLADRYSLSVRLIRNRRARVGAFTDRVLRRAEVPQGGKREAAVALCERLARAGEKVLCFAGDVGALRALQGALATRHLEALLYDDAQGLEARDRLVARFRDPEGPAILLSGESGGEGRNFQFCHHLLCYDLPDSPLTLEQRIGRLDRVGQSRPVEIHVLPEPGEESFLADLYQHEVGIFEAPVGGLDAVLASLPGELKALRGKAAAAKAAFRKALAARVAEGRRAQAEGYDPLLDLRSASLPELAALTDAGLARLGEERPEGGGETAVKDGLQSLSRWLEEELESVCTEIAARVGIEVDTDRNVQAFEASFTLGAGMRIEALPGMRMPEEPETMLGSFWRQTAVARDELHWFATGHPLVEALLGLARDGDAGRSAVLAAHFAPRSGALFARFHLRWPAPADLEPGARVPSRQASRYLDGAPISVWLDLGPKARSRPELAERLERGLAEEAIEDGDAEPPPSGMLMQALTLAEGEARRTLEERLSGAVERLRVHLAAEEARLEAAARLGGVAPRAAGTALKDLQAHGAALEAALAQVGLELDAAALVVPAGE
jgi:ATP-dependent helicase HepA